MLPVLAATDEALLILERPMVDRGASDDIVEALRLVPISTGTESARGAEI